MLRPTRFIDRYRLILLLSLLLTCGFFATTLIGYFVSKQAIRSAIIGQDLPLTSSNIYSEIQKDLVRPVLISSTMAHDTFVRDWVLGGERDVDAMARYLAEVKERHGAFSSFFVSERSSRYYTGAGILKQVSADSPRDAWYYRVRNMQQDYEINVDLDMANRDAMTIFINYRVYDFAGNYLGATGIGLTVDAVRRLIGEYQQRFKRTIYFADGDGRVVFGQAAGQSADLRDRPGLGPLIERILAERSGFYQFEADGDNHILNVNYVPELKWYLFVEQNEDVALAGIRHTLYINFAISLAVTLLVIFLTFLSLRHHQSRIEEMASTDKLTGLLNRHAFDILIDKLLASHRRQPRPIAFLLADVDHFKTINDRHGHRAGDEVLAGIGQLLRANLRAADFAVRWGGEEFLIVLGDCPPAEAVQVAEKLRQAVAVARLSGSQPELQATLSIGISAFADGESIDHAISRADQALYAAKGAGRNQVRSAEGAG